MSCIRKIKIDDTIYNANVDFRVAIRCNEIANDESIGNFERALGIICTMFGKEALNNQNHYDKLINWALKYLSCGKENFNDDEEKDMDYVEDMEYIEASFMSDYNIDLTTDEMEWQKFYKLLNGLSNSELGNCCILNRVRNLRNYDVSGIKDNKERQKVIKMKQQVALKRNKKENHLSKEQEKSMEELNKILGI